MMTEGHWCLLFVDILERKIYYIDPMGLIYESKEIEKIRLNWCKFFKRRSDFKNAKWTSEIVHHCNQHIDDHTNCGVYVCYFF